MNVYPLRKFAFLVTSLIAFKKLLLLSYLPPDNLVLSLITFTIFISIYSPSENLAFRSTTFRKSMLLYAS